MELTEVSEGNWSYDSGYTIRQAYGSIGGARGDIYHVYAPDGTYVAQALRLDGYIARAIKGYEQR